MAKYVVYLIEENGILRDRIPSVIHTRPHERARLLKFGKPLGKGINELITIVTPGTFYRWVREEELGRKKPHDHLPFCCEKPPPENNTVNFDEIVCHEHLGGLIRSYERIAA